MSLFAFLARRALALVVVLFAGVFPLAVQAAPRGFISTQDRHFVDDAGGKVIFRGFNLQAKAPPFQVVTAATDLDPLYRHGANFLRFNFVWEAAEPEKGVYDEAYFAYYDRVIQWAWARGLYVLIDFHNNAYSRHAAKGCGSGFPRWAVEPAVTPVTPAVNGSCVFSSAMMQAMLSRNNQVLWERFMTDADGVRSRFFALTRRLAETYREHPAVIGFDLNEPMVFEPILRYNERLSNAFFNEWHQQIQAVSPRYITFWGDSPFQFIFLNRPPAFDLPAGGQVSFDAHFYEPGASGFGRPVTGTARSINAIIATREAYRMPVLVGEYGANLKGMNNQLFQYQMDGVLRHFDQAFLSSARWNYTPHWTPARKDNFHDEDFSCFDDKRQWRPSCAPRASVQRVAGEPLSVEIHHRGESRFFIPLLPGLSDRNRYTDTLVDFRWKHEPSAGMTRIFADRAIIFGGQVVRISTEGEVQCRWDAQERYVECTSPTGGEKRVILSADPVPAGGA
jgi:hypothetical protein